MWGNKIETISRKTFIACESVWRLDLSDNKITSIEMGAFDHMTTLEKLLLSRNQIEEMPVI